MGQTVSTDQVVLNMRLKAKELERMSRRCEKDVGVQRLKVKVAVEKGNSDGARIYAQNAIRKKHEALNYLKLASKMDAAATRLDAAYHSEQMTQDIHKAVPNLQKAMNSLNVESLTDSMEQFENVLGSLDFRSDYVSKKIYSATANTTPADEVDSLIHQVADEHALDVTQMISQVSNASTLEKGAERTRLVDGKDA